MKVSLFLCMVPSWGGLRFQLAQESLELIGRTLYSTMLASMVPETAGD